MTNNNTTPRPWADPYYEARKAYNEAMAELFKGQANTPAETAVQTQEATDQAEERPSDASASLHNVA